MADDNKPGANFSGGVIVAALATAGIYYFNHQAPLVDLRPAAVTGIEESAPQQVVARLWQDPIAAVERGKSKKQGSTQPCDEEAHQNYFEPPTLAVANTQVLVVTVSGGPYQGDAEGRRRTRYAVLAGLERSGYFPKDERHIKWFLWKRQPTAVSQTSLPLGAGVSAIRAARFIS